MAWDPPQYLKFAGPRLQPGFDLMARIPDRPMTGLVDLGCGTGQLTGALAQRWSEAEVTGLDSAAEMIAQAKEAFSHQDWPKLCWLEGDIAVWQPDCPQDLIFSNSALQWVDGHETLLPRLIEQRAPGGVLAVQMPRNFDQPAHLLLRQISDDGP